MTWLDDQLARMAREAAVPRQYADYRHQLRAGTAERPIGPCELGRAWGYWGGHKADRASTAHLMRYVYDHCHEHGWIRGILCQGCNQRMALVDAGLGVAALGADLGHYERWRLRCPECAARDADLR